MKFRLVPLLLLLSVSILPGQTVPAPSVTFDFYTDASKGWLENGWIGCDNGDTVVTSNAKWRTTFPSGPAFRGRDSLLFEWEHKSSGWTSGAVARDWWIPVEISDFLNNSGRVEFMAKSDKGGEDITVSLSGGENINSPSLRVSSYLGGSKLTQEWRKISVPLADFTTNFFNKSENRIQTVGFGIDYGLAGKHKVYLDDIRLVHYYGNPDTSKGVTLTKELPAARPVPDPVPTPLTGAAALKWQLAESPDLGLAGLKELGLKAVRIDFPWIAIEPRQGEFSFLDYDRIIAECRRNGIEVVGCVKGTPFWARRTNENAGPGEFTLRPPRNQLDWAAFLVHLATRFGNGIRYWEIWENEDASMTPAEYRELFETADRAFKTVAPASIMISGCVKNSGFLKEISTSPAVDIAGWRIDGDETDPGQALKSIPDVAKPVWITSAGASRAPDCAARKQWRERLLSGVKTSGRVKAVFWFELLDDNRDPLFPQSGLLDAGYRPKCR